MRSNLFFYIMLTVSTAVTLIVFTYPSLADFQKGAVSQQTSPFLGDKRLSKPVTMGCASIKLTDLLQRLENRTEVKLNASEPWIGEMSMTLCADALPAHILLENIARLHNLTWSAKTENGAPGLHYVLSETEKNKRLIDRIIANGQKQFRARLDKIRRLSRMSEDALKQLAEDGDFEARIFSNPKARVNAQVIDAVPQERLMAMEDGDSFRLPLSALPDVVSASITHIIADNASDDLASHCSVQFLLRGEGASANIVVTYHYPGGSMMPMGYSSDGEPQDTWRTLSAFAPSPKRFDATVPIEKPLIIKGWKEYVKFLNSRFHLNIFSDFYPEMKRRDNDANEIQIPVGALSLRSAMEWAGAWQRIGWIPEGDSNTVFALRPDWYEFRDRGAVSRYEWKYKSQKNHFIVDDYCGLLSETSKTQARIAALTNLAESTLESDRDFLRFLRNMSATARAELFSNRLQCATMSDEDRKALRVLLEAQFPNLANDFDTSAVKISSPKSSGNTIVSVEFRKISDNGLITHSWLIPAPLSVQSDSKK